MMNIPNIQTPSIEVKSDCNNLDFCNQLDIVTNDCYRGAHPAKRCSQGDFAQIKLLARILKKQAG
ncbi:hypothetical protein [Dehalobacter sp. TeCB1]|uniref:hypothetical protein n=1 Tax=Dehalobacter sp. TeCB1 TaxID=1843715 RepID=UPI00083AEE60|nr:hypothetical protein [Dehalobacter sp. TeCB1]OCZ49735.1 hypothetical protein A7D23_02585 [Dehalobacter sp. TeCB1]